MLAGFQGNTFPLRVQGIITANDCAQFVDQRTVKDSGGACGGGTSGVTAAGTLASGNVVTGVGGKAVQDSGLAAANLVNATAPGVGIAHFAGSTQTVTSSAVNLAGADVTGVLPQANGGSIGFGTSGWCQGAVGTANATAYALNPATNSTNNNCQVPVSSIQDPPFPIACTAYNLYVTASTAGGAAGSGVMAVAKNNSAQTLTCTLGTGTACNDTTHTFSIAAGDRIRIQVTTGQLNDTTANIRATFLCK